MSIKFFTPDITKVLFFYNPITQKKKFKSYLHLIKTIHSINIGRDWYLSTLSSCLVINTNYYIILH